MGFDEFFNTFRNDYLNKLSKRFYPEYITSDIELDTHKVFVVKYAIDEDTSLSYHFDNAEITLNVSLGKKS